MTAVAVAVLDVAVHNFLQHNKISLVCENILCMAKNAGQADLDMGRHQAWHSCELFIERNTRNWEKQTEVIYAEHILFKW